MKYATMAVDGSYSDSPYGGSHIDGYNPINPEEKTAKKSGKGRFLKDAMILLGQVADVLTEKGLDKNEIGSHPSGPACSGEVVAEFWRSDDLLKRIWVEIGTATLDISSGRKDGVCIMARSQPYRMQSGCPVRGISGYNRFFSPDMNSRDLAKAILEIYAREYRAGGLSYDGKREEPVPAVEVAEAAGLPAYKFSNSSMQMDLNLKEPVFIPKEQMSLL